MCLCFMCSHYVCKKREKHREKLQIRKRLRLCCIWPGSPGQLGYHVMEKIAIFSSGCLTYLSPLTDTPPSSTLTYPATTPPSLFLPFFPTSPFRLCLTHSSAVGFSKSPLLLHVIYEPSYFSINSSISALYFKGKKKGGRMFLLSPHSRHRDTRTLVHTSGLWYCRNSVLC